MPDLQWPDGTRRAHIAAHGNRMSARKNSRRVIQLLGIGSLGICVYLFVMPWIWDPVCTRGQVRFWESLHSGDQRSLRSDPDWTLLGRAGVCPACGLRYVYRPLDRDFRVPGELGDDDTVRLIAWCPKPCHPFHSRRVLLEWGASVPLREEVFQAIAKNGFELKVRDIEKAVAGRVPSNLNPLQ